MLEAKDGRKVFIGTSGQTDLIVGIRRPDHWTIGFCEVKTSSGYLSYKQILTLKEHHAAGRDWCVSTSVEDAMRWIADPMYHGADRFTRAVLDPNYRHKEPAVRTRARKPHPLDDLMEAKRTELFKRSDLGEVPF